jgi:hypothetical protein
MPVMGPNSKTLLSVLLIVPEMRTILILSAVTTLLVMPAIAQSGLDACRAPCLL